MILRDVFPDLDLREELANLEVNGVFTDSRKLLPGSLFLALNGLTQHGMQHAAQAAANGAVAIACEAPCPKDVTVGIPVLNVDDLSQRAGDVAHRVYAEPSTQMSMLGVTGTDGKTSVTHFLAQALTHLGRSAGVLGTLGNGLLGELVASSHTTQDAASVHQHLASLLEQGANAVSMEVSSHALDQGRVNGVAFDVAVFTNLSRDHLDYHGSMQAYAEAKRRLMDWSGLSAVVVNADDAVGRQWIDAWGEDERLWAYGLGEAPAGAHWVSARDLQLHARGIRARIVTSAGDDEVNLELVGRFNLLNVLAVVASLLALGFEWQGVRAAIEHLQPVDGRMQLLPGTPSVVVDFAHTPAALEQALQALREQTHGRLLCVFGCGGDRDAGKRPMMGEIAGRLADRVWITDDNPRSENPASIAAQVLAGVREVGKASVVQPRERAIEEAIAAANDGDVLLLAGKGHETYQIIGDQTLPFSDREWALKYLREVAA